MVDHLQMAWSYLNQYEAELDRNFDPIKVRDALGFAADHLSKARQQNLNATITVTEDKQEKTFTLDQVSARALLYEASVTMATNPDRALTAIQKSINYNPTHYAYRLLAQIHVKRYDREAASQALNEALRLNPAVICSGRRRYIGIACYKEYIEIARSRMATV